MKSKLFDGLSPESGKRWRRYIFRASRQDSGHHSFFLKRENQKLLSAQKVAQKVAQNEKKFVEIQKVAENKRQEEFKEN